MKLSFCAQVGILGRQIRKGKVTKLEWLAIGMIIWVFAVMGYAAYAAGELPPYNQPNITIRGEGYVIDEPDNPNQTYQDNTITGK